ncbi:hypothetical protein A7J50_6023 (plasmid) [Pseudomonas antarctica]|uniref:Uncharacterized protein n=1 Tax=Pseudomonas antarctica TaxID=219572 RepID=A0A172Z9X6_9PSED|nr:hypothetical protein [Pseudomonas antarctica]ANF89315.1 hypothetical protein A7J50_6023 [Pseudomonas antarctica]
MSSKKRGHTLILGGKAEPSGFSPLKVARTSPEFMVQLLELTAGKSLDDEQKQTVITVLAGLPEDATVMDLENALAQYQGLAPIFKALQQMQIEGVHAGFFAKSVG